jgi:hypothetical protein
LKAKHIESLVKVLGEPIRKKGKREPLLTLTLEELQKLSKESSEGEEKPTQEAL